MSMIDRTPEGRRVRLVHTSDPHTGLKSGDTGTARYYRNALSENDGRTLVVEWDGGSRLALIEGLDRWEFTS